MLDIATQKSFQERFSAIRTLSTDTLVSDQDKTTLTFKEAGDNAFFEYLGKTYFVKERNNYEETSDDYKTKKGYFVYELNCLCIETGKTSHFEWEYDDELEVTLTLERFTFRNLKDDTGEAIDGDDLDQIAEDKDVVVIKDEKFWYSDDWASVYSRKEAQENVYMYEFENESGTKFLTIEEWSGSGKEEYQIYTSSPVVPRDITIISKGDL